jgi:hypothetical protein
MQTMPMALHVCKARGAWLQRGQPVVALSVLSAAVLVAASLIAECPQCHTVGGLERWIIIIVICLRLHAVSGNVVQHSDRNVD